MFNFYFIHDVYCAIIYSKYLLFAWYLGKTCCLIVVILGYVQLLVCTRRLLCHYIFLFFFSWYLRKACCVIVAFPGHLQLLFCTWRLLCHFYSWSLLLFVPREGLLRDCSIYLVSSLIFTGADPEVVLNTCLSCITLNRIPVMSMSILLLKTWNSVKS